MLKLKFFLEWLVEKIKAQFKWAVGLVVIAFGATTVPQLYHHSFPDASPVVDTSEDSARAPASVDETNVKNELGSQSGQGASADSSASVNESRYSSGENQGMPEMPNAAVPQNTGIPAVNRGGGGVAYGGGDASRNPSSGDHSKSAKPNSATGDSGDQTAANGVLSPFPSATSTPAASGTGSGGYSPMSATIPVGHLPAMPGYTILSGGGMCTASQMQAQVSVGSVIGVAIQTGSGMMVVNGMPGVFFQN